MQSQRWKNTMGLAQILTALFGVPALVFAVLYMFDEGYLGSYWEQYDSVYDPKMKVRRCIGENGELMDDLDSPCLVLTFRAMKAQDRRIKKCELTGATHEVCLKESFDWLYSVQPKPH